jgi:hypothetical protein
MRFLLGKGLGDPGIDYYLADGERSKAIISNADIKSGRYPPRQKACDDKGVNTTSVVRKLEETETTRRQIRTLLEEGPHTAKEISSAVHRPEKEVENHLEHLRKSLHSEGRRLGQIPAECRGCGFVFRKRDRLKAPSRCPVCKGEGISDPSFRVTGGQD